MNGYRIVKITEKPELKEMAAGWFHEKWGVPVEAYMKHIKVCGIYTHLCASDCLDTESANYTKGQIGHFYGLLNKLKEKGIIVPKIHIQSSYGLLNYPELRCSYVRAGVALYGVLSSAKDKTRLQPELKPVLSLKSHVVLLKSIKKSESAGYGRAFTAERDCRIAVIPLGYADGYPRCLSCGGSYVLINGHKAPVLGKVCMDQLTVDVTGIPGTEVGTAVTLIGRDGDEVIMAAELADDSKSIANELLSRLGQRLKTVTVYR